MICPKRTSNWWPFHSWDEGVLHFPPELSDGAGGCWAGELILTCSKCGAKHYGGIWARDGNGIWSLMRPSRIEDR